MLDSRAKPWSVFLYRPRLVISRAKQTRAHQRREQLRRREVAWFASTMLEARDRLRLKSSCLRSQGSQVRSAGRSGTAQA
jgi:hypothetical protein